MLLGAFDNESNGLLPGSRAVEIALVIFDDETGEVVETFSTLVNPQMPIPPDVSKIHSITDEMVADAPNAGEAIAMLYERMPSGLPLIGHNICFDTGILSWDAARFGVPVDTTRPVTCTLEIAKTFAARGNSLDKLIEKHGIKRQGEAHRALSDALACKDYYLLMRGKHKVKPCAWAFAGHDYAYTSAFPDHLQVVPELTRTGDHFAFAYEDDKGKRTERALTPYGWYQKNGALYLQGYCHLRKERRTFRADRIVSLLAA